jgi:hypothetical protein
MPLLALSDLLSAETADEVLATFLSVGTALGLPVTAWQRLGVARSILATVAQKGADLSDIISEIAAGGFLDFAAAVTPEGGPGWLDLVAQEVYGQTRSPATFARGPERFTNSSGVSYGPFAVGELHVSSTSTGQTYSNAVPIVSIPAGGFVDADVVADNPGAVGSAAPTAIDNMVTPLTGVTCSNAAALTGTDVQSNANLVVQCRASLAALSPNGPKDAYNYFARRSVRGDGTIIGVTRTVTVTDPALGTVDVYVATANGPVAGGDLPFVDAAIQTQAVPLATTATTHNTVANAVTVAGTIKITSTNLTDPQLTDLIAAQLTRYFGLVPIGGFSGVVYAEGIRSQIAFALSGIFVTCTLTTPVGDVALAQNEVPTLVPNPVFVITRI